MPPTMRKPVKIDNELYRPRLRQMRPLLQMRAGLRPSRAQYTFAIAVAGNAVTARTFPPEFEIPLPESALRLLWQL